MLGMCRPAVSPKDATKALHLATSSTNYTRARNCGASRSRACDVTPLWAGTVLRGGRERVEPPPNAFRPCATPPGKGRAPSRGAPCFRRFGCRALDLEPNGGSVERERRRKRDCRVRAGGLGCCQRSERRDPREGGSHRAALVDRVAVVRHIEAGAGERRLATDHVDSRPRGRRIRARADRADVRERRGRRLNRDLRALAVVAGVDLELDVPLDAAAKALRRGSGCQQRLLLLLLVLPLPLPLPAAATGIATTANRATVPAAASKPVLR